MSFYNNMIVSKQINIVRGMEKIFVWETFRPLYAKVCIIMFASKYINIRMTVSDSLLLFE